MLEVLFRCPVSYTHLDVYKRQTMFTSLSDLVTSLGELRIKHVSIERYDGFLGQKEDEKEENLAVEELDDHGIRMEHLCFCLLYTSRCV